MATDRGFTPSTFTDHLFGNKVEKLEAWGLGIKSAWATGDLEKWQTSLGSATSALGGFNSDYKNLLDISLDLHKVFPGVAEDFGKISVGLQQAGVSLRATDKDLKAWMETTIESTKVLGLSADATGLWIREMKDLGNSAAQTERSLENFRSQVSLNNLTQADGIKIMNDAQKAWQGYGGVVGMTQEHLSTKFLEMNTFMRALDINADLGATYLNSMIGDPKARRQATAMMSAENQRDYNINAAALRTPQGVLESIRDVLSVTARQFPEMFGKSDEELLKTHTEGEVSGRQIFMRQMADQYGPGMYDMASGFLAHAIDKKGDVDALGGIDKLVTNPELFNSAVSKWVDQQKEGGIVGSSMRTTLQDLKLNAATYNSNIARQQEVGRVSNAVELLKQTSDANGAFGSAVNMFYDAVHMLHWDGLGGTVILGALEAGLGLFLYNAVKKFFLGDLLHKKSKNSKSPLEDLGLTDAHICCNPGCFGPGGTGTGGTGTGGGNTPVPVVIPPGVPPWFLTGPWAWLLRAGLTAGMYHFNILGLKDKVHHIEKQFDDFHKNFDRNGGSSSLFPHTIGGTDLSGGLFHAKPVQDLSKFPYLDAAMSGVPLDSVGRPTRIHRSADGSVSGISYASWYGPGFNGHRTATGEIYDQEGLTVARNTNRGPTKNIPYGSLVEFTNPATGKTVVVRVNDNGPLDGPTGKRDWDLSLGAADALGVTSAGVSKLPWRVVDRDPRDPWNIVGKAPKDPWRKGFQSIDNEVGKVISDFLLWSISKQPTHTDGAPSDLGNRIGLAAKATASEMHSFGHCLQGVNNTFKRLGIKNNPFGESDAYKMQAKLAHDSRFQEIPLGQQQVGDVEVWGRGKLGFSSDSGHIEIVLPGGATASDHITKHRDMTKATPNDVAIYRLIDVLKTHGEILGRMEAHAHQINQNTGATAASTQQTVNGRYLTPDENDK